MQFFFHYNYTDDRPTFHGDFFGGYDPETTIIEQLIKDYVKTKENETLILVLIKEEPTGAGIKF